MKIVKTEIIQPSYLSMYQIAINLVGYISLYNALVNLYNEFKDNKKMKCFMSFANTAMLKDMAIELNELYNFSESISPNPWNEYIINFPEFKEFRIFIKKLRNNMKFFPKRKIIDSILEKSKNKYPTNILKIYKNDILYYCGYFLGENITVKEYKKITSNLEKELNKKESNLKKSINNLEEQFKTNKPIIFDKESVKVKKETLDTINQVIKEAKKIEEMEPKLNSAFKSMNEFSNNIKNIQKENNSLNKEVSNLKIRNESLEKQTNKLRHTIDYLEDIIRTIIEFVYRLFKDYNVSYDRKEEFYEEYEEFIPDYVDKDYDSDFEL